MNPEEIKELAKKLEGEYPYSARKIKHIIYAYHLKNVNEKNVRRIIEANMNFEKVKVTGGVRG